MADESIHLIITFNKTKASIVERWIRKLKTKMWRYFTANITMRYIDMLQDLLYSYNHSMDHIIKKKPANVNIENIVNMAKCIWR